MENIQRTNGEDFLPVYEKGIYNLNFVDGQSYNKKNDNEKDKGEINIKDLYTRYLKFRNKLFKDFPISKLYLYNTKDIISLPQDELIHIIKEGLNDEDVNVRKISAEMIQYIKNENSKKRLYTKLKSVIEKGLNDEDEDVRESSAKMIQYIQEDSIKKELIEKGLNNEYVDVRKISAEMIQCVQDDGIKEELYVKLQYVIEKGLDNENWYVRKCSTEMIQYIQNVTIKKELYAKLRDVIEKGLNNADWYVRKCSAEMIQYIQDDDTKKGLIEKGLNNEDVNVRKISAEMIQYIQNVTIKKELYAKLTGLIKKGLDDEDLDVRIYSAGMIQYIQDDNIRKDLIEMLKAKGLFEKYNLPKKKSDHSLYKYNGYQRKISGEKSEIDKLVDDKHQDMLGKVYKRTTSLNPFLLQMKAFENYKIWEEEGLDHIPVETIYRFRAERDKDGNLKNNRISFFAKVYDGTLLNLENTDLYYIIHQKEIEEQKRKILKGLEKLNIDHGDFLSQNICISWLRDENNKPDFTKAPLLYLIDWDSAKIKK